MNVGDVVWVDFPTGAGRAQAGRRPAIVAQAAQASSTLPTVLLIPLTTQQDALRFPGTVLIEADAASGLRRPSVALVFQLTAIDKRFSRSATRYRSSTSHGFNLGSPRRNHRQIRFG